MAGLFNGLEIGKRALATHQLWMNTIGHNIANVNTPGYTRQRVAIASTLPFDHAKGPVGTGVDAIGVRHIRDLFLNQQYRKESMELGRWSAAERTLGQIEELFYEPNEGSISNLLNEFWNSWSDVATEPEEHAYRNTLITNTKMLTEAFHRVDGQLSDLRKSVDGEIKLLIENINNLAGEVASLNMQIARTELGTDRANDLRDKRDLIIDELSKLARINVVEESTGSATVFIGAMALVDRDNVYKLSTYKSGAGETTLNQVVWAGTDKSVKFYGGQLDSLLELRDETIPRYVRALDELAAALVNSINSVHSTGYGLDNSTGLNFFDPNDQTAAGIRLSDDIGSVADRIAAASEPDAVGNNINALAIADLRNALLMKDNTVTISGFYQSLIGKVGADSGTARHTKENLELLVAQVDNARQSVQGVSLDEEMAQMIRFQHAYDAAARVITTMDEALETVISKMGIIGR